MTNLDECVITVPVVGGVFGVGRLATRLKGLVDTEQIGPWHIGQWIDFKLLQSGYDSGPLRIVSARGRPAPAQQAELSSLPMAFNMFRPPLPSRFGFTT
jgi:hypothetical protein